MEYISHQAHSAKASLLAGLVYYIILTKNMTILISLGVMSVSRRVSSKLGAFADTVIDRTMESIRTGLTKLAAYLIAADPVLYLSSLRVSPVLLKSDVGYGVGLAACSNSMPKDFSTTEGPALASSPCCWVDDASMLTGSAFTTSIWFGTWPSGRSRFAKVGEPVWTSSAAKLGQMAAPASCKTRFSGGSSA